MVLNKKGPAIDTSSKLLNLDPDGFIYEDTKDPEHLKQFLELRKKIFGADKVTAKSLKQNEGWDYGLDTHVLIARNENKVIAGAIIVINNCQTDTFFSFECENFQLHKQFPEYELHKNTYASFQHFIVHEDYRTNICSQNLFRCLYNMCISNNIKLLFGIASNSRARRNRIALHKLNIDLDLKILNDIQLPERDSWNGFRRYLIVADLRKKLV